MGIAYVIEQDTAEGLWTSEAMSSDDMRHVRQTIVAGFFGEARRAVSPDGVLIYGVDRKGKPVVA